MRPSSSASSISLTNSRLTFTGRLSARVADTLAVRRCIGRSRRFIAGGADHHDLAGRSAGFSNQARHRVRLPQRQRAAARANPHWSADSAILLVEREQPAQRVGVLRPRACVSPAFFNCSVGCSSSFSTISRVISSTRARASGGSAGQLRLEPFELRLADRLESLPQRDDRRNGFARSLPGRELLHFVVDDLFGAADFARRASRRFSRTIACRSSML